MANWKTSEVRYIKDNQNLTVSKLAGHLGRSTASVISFCNRNGIIVHRCHKVSLIDKLKFGDVNSDVLDLLIDISSISSEPVINALRMHLIDGKGTVESSVNLINGSTSQLTRAVSKVSYSYSLIKKFNGMVA